MTTGERIKLLRERRGMKKVQLAVRSGLDQSYLSKLEQGKVGWSAEGLHAIARVLGVTTGALIDGVMGEDAPVPAKYGMVPVFDFMQAGSPRGIGANFAEENVANYVYCDLPRANELFALIVRGGSMEPSFIEGDIVIFRRGLAPEPGDFVVATSAEVGGAFRRYRDLGPSEGGGSLFSLAPVNENYATFRSDQVSWKIEGTLVRHIRDYRR